MSRLILSVIIATRHRKQQLVRCLDSLCGQNYPREKWELIVVHDGEDRESEDCAASYRDLLPLRSLVQPQAGPGIARNTGAAAALGEYLIFTMMTIACFPPDWLHRYDASFRANTGCLIAGGAINWLPANPYSQQALKNDQGSPVAASQFVHKKAPAGYRQQLWSAYGRRLFLEVEGLLANVWRKIAISAPGGWGDGGQNCLRSQHCRFSCPRTKSEILHPPGSIFAMDKAPFCFIGRKPSGVNKLCSAPAFMSRSCRMLRQARVWLLILLSQAAHTLGFHYRVSGILADRVRS